MNANVEWLNEALREAYQAVQDAENEREFYQAMEEADLYYNRLQELQSVAANVSGRPKAPCMNPSEQ